MALSLCPPIMEMRQTSSRTGSKSSLHLGLVWLLLLALVLLISRANGQEHLNEERRQQKENEELTKTIRLLENIDKYMSHMSRPRFGRSEYKQPSQYLQPADQQQQQQQQLLLLPQQQPVLINGESYQISPLVDWMRAKMAAGKYNSAAL